MTMTDTDVRERPAVRFQLLGALRAWLADEEITLGANKQQAVLAILLLNANKGVSMDRIIDAVWGDEPPHSGANVVHKYIAGLRRALEPERAPRAPGALLGRTSTGYVLRVESDQLDTTLFETLVRKGRTAHADGHAVDATAQLTEALALWQGEPLYGLRGPAFDTARDRLDEDRAGALEDLAEIDIDAGRFRDALPTLTRLVDEYPLRERFRYLLMLALYRSGRKAEALAAYESCRRFLADELGVDPGQDLQELHLRILRSDIVRKIPPTPEPQRTWSPELLLVAAPVVTLGAGTWLVFLTLAIFRAFRGKPGAVGLAVSSAAYLLAATAALVAWLGGSPALLAILAVTMWGGAMQVALALPAPHPRGPDWLPVALRVFAGLIPFLTAGTGGWAIVGYYGVRRRNRLLIASAIGYFIIVMGFFALVTTTWMLAAIFLFVVGATASAVQAALVDPAG